MCIHLAQKKISRQKTPNSVELGFERQRWKGPKSSVATLGKISAGKIPVQDLYKRSLGKTLEDISLIERDLLRRSL